MSNITVYGIPGSPFVRSVEIVLREKGANYALHPVGAGEIKGEEHLKRHPFGRVPAVDHDGFRLYETQAILRYFDQIFPEPSLTPNDARTRARMNQIIGIIDWYLFPKAAAPIGFNRVVGPALLGLVPDETAIEQAMPMAQTCITELDGLLADQPYLTGTQFTLADIMLAAQLDLFSYSPEGASLLRGTKELQGWLDRVRSRPSMQATQIPPIFAKAA